MVHTRKKIVKKVEKWSPNYFYAWNETKATEGGLGQGQFLSEANNFKENNPTVRVKFGVSHSPFVGHTSLDISAPTKRELKKAMRWMSKHTGYQGFTYDSYSWIHGKYE